LENILMLLKAACSSKRLGGFRPARDMREGRLYHDPTWQGSTYLGREPSELFR